ncbi:MAG: M23 family metallopeptidase [Dehalococcoidia bacterium]
MRAGCPLPQCLRYGMLVLAVALVLPLLAAGCGDNDRAATPTFAPATATTTPSATAAPSPTATAIPPTSTPTPRGPQAEPIGFPIDPATTLGLVSGEVGSRTLTFGAGPAALAYSRDEQPSSDLVLANRAGWNCRVHVEYEGLPAVDWYIPTGTPIVATMDGTATLLINTVSNPFDVYGVSREPYIGNPDRSRAPVSAFPGPGGGQGVFVRVDNGTYRTDYAHLELAQTMAEAVPGGAWLPGFTPGQALTDQFTPLRDFRTATAVARWEVAAGDVIGYSGDSGYSEAPHLHYTVQSGGSYFCPTAEPGFNNAGWLLR